MKKIYLLLSIFLLFNNSNLVAQCTGTSVDLVFNITATPPNPNSTFQFSFTGMINGKCAFLGLGNAIIRWSGTNWEIYDNPGFPSGPLVWTSNVSTGTLPPNSTIGNWTVTPAFVGIISMVSLTGNGTTNIALPIDLQSFNATSSSEGILLNWITSSELNNDYFIVERSIDGSHFDFVTKIETKATSGNSQLELAYNVLDDQASNGKVFYRLKQVDIDGQFNYSTVIFVFHNNKNSIQIYPNPMSTLLSIDFGSELNNARIIRMYDVSGKMVKEKQILGENLCQFNIADLDRGFYTIQIIENNTIIYTDKLIKED